MRSFPTTHFVVREMRTKKWKRMKWEGAGMVGIEVEEEEEEVDMR
jgi:hypothetical protein